jgi:Lrp/AsnC family transcriptional regulator
MDIVLDHIDRHILRELQKDATLAIGDLALEVGLSQTPCWKRVRRLTEAGVITRRVALLDPDKLNLGLVVFVSVRADQHEPERLAAFAKTAAAMPEVIEFYRLSGDADYLLKIVVKDLAAYDAFYKRLIAAAPLFEVRPAFAMERIKQTSALPV